MEKQEMHAQDESNEMYQWKVAEINQPNPETMKTTKPTMKIIIDMRT